jgi:hypothetical protein
MGWAGITISAIMFAADERFDSDVKRRHAWRTFSLEDLGLPVKKRVCRPDLFTFVIAT